MRIFKNVSFLKVMFGCKAIKINKKIFSKIVLKVFFVLFVLALIFDIYGQDSLAAVHTVAHSSRDDFESGTMSADLDAESNPGSLQLSSLTTDIISHTDENDFGFGTNNKTEIVDTGSGASINISRTNWSLGDNYESIASGTSGLTGMFLDEENDKLYYCDSANGRIVMMDSGTGDTTFGANSITFGSWGNGVDQFAHPEDIFVDTENNKAFVADASNDRIVMMDSGGGGTTLGDNFTSFGVLGDSGSGKFDYPRSIAVDVNENKLYVSDKWSGRGVLMMDSGTGGTNLGDNWIEFGTLGSGPGQFNRPTGLSISENDHKIYVADIDNHRIVMMDSETGSTNLGDNFTSFGSDGTGNDQFHGPYDTFVDEENDKVFVADLGNNRIVNMDSGSSGTTFGANFTAYGTIGSGVGQFDGPYSVYFFYGEDIIFVADQNDDRLIKFNAGVANNYFLSGTYESDFVSSEQINSSQISWNGSSSAGTSITMQTRTANLLQIDNQNESDTSNVYDYHDWGGSYNLSRNNGVLSTTNPSTDDIYLNFNEELPANYYPAGSTVTARVRLTTNKVGSYIYMYTDDWSGNDAQSTTINEWVTLSFVSTVPFSMIGFNPWNYDETDPNFKFEVDWIAIGDALNDWSTVCSNSIGCDVENSNSVDYVQYRANLSSEDYSSTPSLADVSIKKGGYQSFGTYLSPVVDAGAIVYWRSLVADVNILSGTSITLQTRTGNTDTPDSTWSDWNNLSNTIINSSDARYLQYRAVFATESPLLTPVLNDVVIEYIDGNVFVENFSTVDYRDDLNSTVKWDINNKNVKENIDSTTWTHANVSISGAENISDTSDESAAYDSPMILTDSDGNTFAAWTENVGGSNEEIFFRRADSAGWGDVENISQTLETSHAPVISINNEGNPIVAWSEVVTTPSWHSQIVVAWRNGGIWEKHAIENPYNDMASDKPRIIIDSDGNPHVIWVDLYNANHGVYYAHWNGSEWVGAGGTIGVEQIFSGAAKYPNLILDENNHPMVVWYNNQTFSDDLLLFSRWNGSAWTQVDGVTSGYGTVQTMTDDSGASASPQLHCDRNGNPFIVWRDPSNSPGEIYASRWTGSTWDNDYVGSTNSAISSVMDDVGDLYIVWDQNYSEIYLVRWNGLEWTHVDGLTAGSENISDTTESSWSPSIAISPETGNPFVIWSENVSGYSEMFYSEWNGETWTQSDSETEGSENISNTSGNSGGAQIAFGTNGLPRVLWVDSEGNGDLYYAQLEKTYISPSIAQSVKINGSVTGITKATIMVVESVESETSIAYFLSNDGGLNWYEVTKNEEFLFPSSGNDLRWKASLSGNDNTPQIGHIVVAYSNSGVTSSDTPPAPKIEEVKEISKDSVKLKIQVDPSYANQELDFEIKIKNRDKDDVDNEEQSKRVDENGEVILTIDDLKSGTDYSISVRFSLKNEESSSDYSETEKLKTARDIEDDDKCIVDNLKAKKKNGKALLFWDKACSEINGILIERKINSSSYKQIDSLGRKEIFYEDSDIAKYGNYTYRIRGFKGDKYTDYSKEASVIFAQINEKHNNSEFDQTGNGLKNYSETEKYSEEQEEIVDNEIINADPAKKKSIVSVWKSKMKDLVINFSAELFAVAIFGLTVGTAMAASSANIPFFPTSPESLGQRLFAIIGMLSNRKRKSNDWGTVFDSDTKQLICGAVVSLINDKGHVVDTVTSDSRGRYGFLPNPGAYKVSVFKNNYKLETRESMDSLYGNVYTGNVLYIGEGRVEKINIALGNTKIDWHDFAKRKIASLNSAFSIFKRDFFISLFYSGAIISAGIALMFPSVINFIIVAIYVLLIVYQIFFKKKSFGTVTQLQSGKPIPFAVISLYNENDLEKRVKFAVSDVLGRYYLLIENGDYVIKVSGTSLDGNKVEKAFSAKIKEGIIKSDLKI